MRQRLAILTVSSFIARGRSTSPSSPSVSANCLRLLEHDAGKPAHRGFAERRKQEPELFVHEFGGGVVRNTASEDGYRELIDGFGVQLVLGRAEVHVVGFGSGEENKLAGTEPEPDEFALLVPAAAQHRDRILLKIQQMTDQRPPTCELGNGFCRREPRRTQGCQIVRLLCHPCLQ